MIPAGAPPFKTAQTPYEHRFRMVELACEGDARLVASRMEEVPGKSYSINTIERLKVEGGELYFIIGADAFADIEKWYRAQDLMRAVEFIVVGRPGWKYAVPGGARVHRMDTLELPVSSTKIREQLARGSGWRSCRRRWRSIFGRMRCTGSYSNI